MVDEDVEGVAREPVGGGAVAGRWPAGGLHDHVHAALEPVPLLAGRHLVGVLVQVVVGGRPRGRRSGSAPPPGGSVRCTTPAGRRSAACRTRGRGRRGGGPPPPDRSVAPTSWRSGVGAAVVGEVQDAVGIHVEGERDRAAGAAGPGRRVGDHAVSACVTNPPRRVLPVAHPPAPPPRTRPAPNRGTPPPTRCTAPRGHAAQPLVRQVFLQLLPRPRASSPTDSSTPSLRFRYLTSMTYP